MANRKTAQCPRCNALYFVDYGAISRRDSSTRICGVCGTGEAMEDMHERPFDGKPYWKIEDGGCCPKCRGVMGFEPAHNCSCHINPPCVACTSVPLTCLTCGWENEDDK